MAFPVGDYTPFGYLANPYHRARTYVDVDVGSRSMVWVRQVSEWRIVANGKCHDAFVLMGSVGWPARLALLAEVLEIQLFQVPNDCVPVVVSGYQLSGRERDALSERRRGQNRPKFPGESFRVIGDKDVDPRLTMNPLSPNRRRHDRNASRHRLRSEERRVGKECRS